MNVEKSLQKAGVDTKKYPSLSMQNILGYKCKSFGENSHWYKQIMEDGHVFNPYIHRRWLPHQFMDKVYWGVGYNPEFDYWDMIDTYVREMNNTYNFHYIYQKLLKELNAQYTLHKRDKKAYEERKAAFSKSEAFSYWSLYEYEGEDLTRDMNYLHIRDILERELSKAKTRQWDIARCELGISRDLRERVALGFIRSGIYFTLKHIVMFDCEKLDLGPVSQKDYLKDMRKDLINDDFSFDAAFEVVKEYVKDNYDPYRH